MLLIFISLTRTKNEAFQKTPQILHQRATQVAKGTDVVTNVFNIRYYSHLKKISFMEWLARPSDLTIIENF